MLPRALVVGLFACAALVIATQKGEAYDSVVQPQNVLTALTQPNFDVSPAILPPDMRGTCAEIKGTEYQDWEEMEFYRASCINVYVQPSASDRTSCSAIRGTEYYSWAERDFYLANCLGTTAPATARAASPPPVVVNSAPTGGSMEAAICALPWPCQEALSVARHESGIAWVYNTQGSGACGPFQTLPCVGWQNLPVHLAEAFRKWQACGGGSFSCAWYAWW